MNALLLSLLLLVPDTQVGAGVVAVGVVGLVAVLGLLTGLASQRHQTQRAAVARAVVLLLGQGVVYAYEIWLGVRLGRTGDPTDELKTLCLLIIVLFVVGIERAWEFVGARSPGLWDRLLGDRTPRARPRPPAPPQDRGPSDVG